MASSVASSSFQPAAATLAACSERRRASTWARRSRPLDVSLKSDPAMVAEPDPPCDKDNGGACVWPGDLQFSRPPPATRRSTRIFCDLNPSSAHAQCINVALHSSASIQSVLPRIGQHGGVKQARHSRIVARRERGASRRRRRDCQPRNMQQRDLLARVRAAQAPTWPCRCAHLWQAFNNGRRLARALGDEQVSTLHELVASLPASGA